ncbi:MAG: RpiB/LacA/LacB family sugar-phosphate isomerase [Planctomycetes bacterium]|nr:RpiB/LacA/LacB family sugar-phosphate isomerase [Planctomycetota bacterium]
MNLGTDGAVRDVPLNEKDDVTHVALGSDHTALAQKNIVKTYLESIGYRVTDVGTDTTETVDFPAYAAAVARKVASGACERGIMLDTDGIGSAIVCNKVKKIRAALCYDMRSVVNSREFANANVMTLGGPFHNGAELCEMVKLWLELRFPAGENWSRVNKIMSIERQQ